MAAIKLPGGTLQIEQLPQTRLRVTALPDDASLAIAQNTWETGLSWPLVDAVAASSHVSRVCEELASYDNPALLDEAALHRRIEAYVEPSVIEGQRILDFGCGRGVSTNWLAETYLDAEVVGVDARATLIDLARRVAKERNAPNVFFHRTVAEAEAAGGGFQFVVMSVFDESQVAALWTALQPGGILLVPDPAENRSRVLRRIGQSSAGARPVELRPRAEGEAAAALGFFARLKNRLFSGDPRTALPELAIRKDV